MIEVFSWPTPNGHKIHIMLEETGTPYRVHPVDIGDEIMKTNCSDCHAAGGQDVPGGESHHAKK